MGNLALLIPDGQVHKLEQLATTRGTTENALVEEALNLLFRENERAEMQRQDWEQLQQLEAELGSLPPSTAPPVTWEQARLLAGTPIPPERLRRLGETD